MKQERLMHIILRPYMSEKASLGTEKRSEYAFEVRKNATKPDVKNAVELLFKTEVESVRIVNVKTKPKRFGQIQGKSKAWKKAYVKLKSGQAIDFATV
ncbi:MAG: rplW [Gammaproteobacteria bacterium]|jgi:large subunit ribosomal protein L23|nr:rplW [Gammaproteobacteria bacterium]